jgi:hypothetical protein
MDPYLEGDLWTTFHTQLGAEIARQLAPRLRPRYLAFAEKRFIMDAPEDVAVTIDMYPDVGVAEAGPGTLGGLGAAVATAPLQLTTVIPTPVPHIWVEIRVAAERKLVTAIELLSPANKRGEGRKEYLDKRRRLLLSTAHLMEIDLLREGQRVPMREPLPPTAYYVFLSRVGKRPVTDVWPIGLDEPLPTVHVPLLDGDPDVPLDLQLAFTTVYDLCSYDIAVNYSRSPEVPLPPDATAWAEGRLRTAGMRT